MADDDLDKLKAVMPDGVTLAVRLGQGGQGLVFRGVCDEIPSAIKAFRPDAEPERVDREIKLLSEIQCQHVVRLLKHFTVNVAGEDIHILAYELHTGGDLKAHLVASAPALDERALLRIGTEVGTAINALWGKRIVHRDIKPANIVLADDGRHVLVDLGFARHLELTDLTVAGSPGTRGYKSPEQARGRRKLTKASDIYSLGVTLYHLATKTHPFGGRDLSKPTPLDTKRLQDRGGLSAAFVGTIVSMLDFVPANRPGDVAARFAAIGETNVRPE